MPTNLYALRFISGKYQGGEFPLRMEREVTIGRGGDVDMVLVEDMVSRKHARIVTKGGEISIHDLESTNGTFVNGEKIGDARLKEGDRILIGTSILKLVDSDGSLPMVSEADARRRLEQTEARRVTNNSMRMSGVIDEIPLPDLIQLLSTSKKSGVLVVHSDETGRIFFRKGQIYFSAVDEAAGIRPRKALYRMLEWISGTFALEPPDEKEMQEELTDSTEALLIEGMRQLDERKRIEHELPKRKSALKLCSPMKPLLRDLKPAELDTLQAVLNGGGVQAALDKSVSSDLEVLMILRSLIAREYLVAQ